LAAGLAVAAAILLTDMAVSLAGARAPVYLATVAAGLAAVVVSTVLAARPVPSPLFVARLIEGRRPDLRNALITFAELAAEPDPDLSACGTVARRAARLLVGMPAAEFLPAFAISRPLAAVATSTTVLAACLWLAQGTVVTPWTASAQAGPVIVVDGMPAGVDGTVEGRAPSRPDDHLSVEMISPSEASADRGSPGNAAGGRGVSGKSGTGQSNAAQIGPTGRPVPGGSDWRDPARTGGETESATSGRPDATERVPPGRLATDGGSRSVVAPMGSGRPDTTPVRAGPGGGDVGRSGTRPPYSGPPPLVPRPQSEEFPRDVLGTMRTTRPATNMDRPQGDEKTETFLGQMGAGGPADSKRFSTAWTRGPETPVRGAETAGPRRLGPAAGGEIVPAGLGPGPGARPYRDTGGTADGKRDLVQGDDTPVSARLKPAVAAYFETISRLSAGKE
jgi:hypothetical protein